MDMAGVREGIKAGIFNVIKEISIMKSVRIMKPGEVLLRQEPLPVPAAGEVIIRPKRIGICGTDYNIYNGEFSERVNFPLRPGHEWSGVIESVGEGVVGYAPGDRVMGETAVSCGICEKCVSGRKYECTAVRAVGTVDAYPGAMSEVFTFPARDLLKIPDGVDFDMAALVEPTANAIMAMEDVPVRPGMSVAVMGTGPIGLAAIALARAYGAYPIISVGRKVQKLDVAKKLGATHTVNTDEEDPAAEIKRITNGGADVVIELSGAKSLFFAAANAVKAHGTIELLGFYDSPFEVNMNDFIFNNITLRTAGGGWGGYFDKVLKLMSTGALDELKLLITHRCTLDEAADNIVELKKDNAQKIKVMITLDDKVK